MRVSIDTATGSVVITSDDGTERVTELYGPEGFEVLSDLWLRVGWNQRYSYRFSWLGRPAIQLPEDLLRLQEVVWALRPDVIVETGVAHGGTTVFLASLCRLIGHGRVIGVDIQIHEHNRAAIEAHPVADLITLVEADSTAPATVAHVRELVGGAATVLVVLDSDHSKAHVLRELEAYAPLVSRDSWIVATDGVMRDLADVPRGDASWVDDNPTEAVTAFLAVHPEFELDPPRPPFDESETIADVTYWPVAWLRRR